MWRIKVIGFLEKPRDGNWLEFGLRANEALRATELGVSVENVHSFVLGGSLRRHGVALPRYSTLAGIPLPDLACPRSACRDRGPNREKGGAEIVNLMKPGRVLRAIGRGVEIFAAIFGMIKKDNSLRGIEGNLAEGALRLSSGKTWGGRRRTIIETSLTARKESAREKSVAEGRGKTGDHPGWRRADPQVAGNLSRTA